MNVEPFPGSLSKVIDPLSSSINFFVILNPSPAPSNLREDPSLACLNGSKTIL